MEDIASIILPVYNGEKYIIEMLDSIWRQSYRPIQLIISDDCSTDTSFSIIHSWIKKRQKDNFKINFIHNTRNIGLSANISNVVKRVEGKYLFLADQDDIWLEHKIVSQIDYLYRNPDCVICQCDRSIIDSNNRLICRSENEKLNYMTTKRNLKMVLQRPSIYASNSMCIRADCIENIFPIPKKIVEHDSYIAAIAAHYGNIGYLHRPLTQYRIHDDNISAPWYDGMKFNFIEYYKRRIIAIRRYNKIVKIDDKILKIVLDARYHEDLNVIRKGVNRKPVREIYLYSLIQTLKQCIKNEIKNVT